MEKIEYEQGAPKSSKSDLKRDDRNELEEFLQFEYGFQVKGIAPAKRGFYGETWKVHTEGGEYFVKLDRWDYHMETYRKSLSAVQYMTDSGISFIPKVIKTRNGFLSSSFKKGAAAVFDYVEGELLEDCPLERLFGHLSGIYRLKAGGMGLDTETFGTEPADTFQKLRNNPELPDAAARALARREPVISNYMERLQQLSDACKKDQGKFHITHGDAGGNCILNNSRLYLVDWDTVKLAPAERDAWVYMCDKRQIAVINTVLAENGTDCRLERKRLCYYAYGYFFYYLNEYLHRIASAKEEEYRTTVVESMKDYLAHGWIHKRLDAADNYL